MMATDFNQMVTSVVYSVALTTYYKRSFRRETIPSVLSLLLMAAALDQIGNPVLSLLITIETSIFFFHHAKTINLDMFFVLLFTLMDVRVLHLGNKQYTHLKMLAVALPQFIRKPASLKSKLQGLRSKLGPVYVIYSVSRVFLLCTAKTLTPNVIGELTVASMATAVVAGVLFRPDNDVILRLFGYESQHKDRKTIHGRCMCTSFTCLLLSMILS